MNRNFYQEARTFAIKELEPGIFLVNSWLRTEDFGFSCSLSYPLDTNPHIFVVVASLDSFYKALPHPIEKS